MKKKKLKLLTITLLTLLFIPIYSNANELTLTISTDREDEKIGEEINIKVSWNEEMQAADFYLNYDSDKLEYIKSDIDETFINNDIKEGKLKTAWVSMDDKDKTNINYVFKIKQGGNIKFTTTTDGGFATGQLEIPNKYNEGKLIIKIERYDIFLHIFLFIIVIILICIILRMKRRDKEQK